MEKKACIITGGTLCDSFLTDYADRHPSELVIVVDGALETTHRLGMKPDYIVGDFDTVNQNLRDV